MDHRFRFPALVDRDHVHRKIKAGGTFYEIELLRYLADHVTSPGIAIDCGANIGNHTLFFAGVMGLRTLAVEPVARNFQILEQVIELNDLSDKVEIIRMALDEKAGEVTMTLDNPGNFGMYKVGEGDGPSVKTTTLDTLTGDRFQPHTNNGILCRRQLAGQLRFGCRSSQSV